MDSQILQTIHVHSTAKREYVIVGYIIHLIIIIICFIFIKKIFVKMFSENDFRTDQID